MSERDADWRARLRGAEVSRRGALGALAGGTVTLGAAKAVDNVLVGYGVLTGTNLVDQDLGALAAADFGPSEGFRSEVEGYAVQTSAGRARVTRGDEVLAEEPFEALTAESVADLDLPDQPAGLLLDLGAIGRGEATFEFHQTAAFFDRIEGTDARPLSVEAMRRWPAADAEAVERFADVDPADPRALLHGLTEGFREHTYYDAPRYVAGSIQDNVIFGAADLRAAFREPVEFEAISTGPETGLFCYEFTFRSVEALHAAAPAEQTAPVVGASVIDSRHKHVYTGVASIVRDGDGLSVPMTFVDYTHTTLYDDLRLRGLLGEGFEAYGRRHRATEIIWDPYA